MKKTILVRTLSIILVMVMVITYVPITNLSIIAADDSIPENAIHIKTVAELAAIGGAQSKDKYYVLDNDIYLTSEWIPIDNFLGKTFDGQGHTISNLYVKADSERLYAGLFGIIATENITIKNVKINIGSEGISSYSTTFGIDSTYAGGLVGKIESNNVIISDVQINIGTKEVLSHISIISGTRYSSAGGLIGSIKGDAGFINITNCNTIGNVSAYSSTPGSTGAYAGGLIGECFNNNYTVIIEKSYTTGNITSSSTSQSDAGGLIGLLGVGPQLIVKDCYTTGDISASSGVGGLIGWCATNENVLTIENCYSISNVSSASEQEYAGGLIGTGASYYNVINCYRLSTQVITGNVINQSGTPLTQAQMKQQSSFIGWDFSKTWVMNSSINNGYPCLSYQLTANDDTDFYYVYTSGDLMNLANRVNNGEDFKDKIIYIENDINMISYKWIPIGNEKNPFRGSIDGKGHIISNINNSISVFAGLVGYTIPSNKSSFISNVIIQDMNLSSKSIGGIVGYVQCEANSKLTVSNCKVSGTLNGTSEQGNGGIVGEVKSAGNSYVLIEKCFNEASVSGKNANSSKVGGILGAAYSAMNNGSQVIITQCGNTGNLRAEATFSYNHVMCGGIIGLIENYTTEITQCYNRGNIYASSYSSDAGGLVGNVNLDVTNNFLVSDSFVYSDLIEAPYYSGTPQLVGGILGHSGGENFSSANIINCYVTSYASANSVTGIITEHTNVKEIAVRNCFFDIDKLGIPANKVVVSYAMTWLSGGVYNSFGVKTSELKKKNMYTGWDFDTVWGIDENINDGYPYLIWEQENHIEENDIKIDIDINCDEEIIYENGKFITKQVPVTIKITNLGKKTLTNIKVRAVLDEGISFNKNDNEVSYSNSIDKLDSGKTNVYEILIYPKVLNGIQKIFVDVSDEFTGGEFKEIELNIKTDKWSFKNFTKKIPFEYCVYLWGDTLRSSIFYLSDMGSNGLCYGMAIVNALLKENKPSLNSFKNDTNSPAYISDMKNDDSLEDIMNYKSNSIQGTIPMQGIPDITTGYLSMEEYIYILHLSQKLSKFRSQNDKNKNQYDEIYKKVKNYQETGNNPIVITFTRTNFFEFMIDGGHTVFPIWLEDSDDGLSSYIYVYDSTRHLIGTPYITLSRNKPGGSIVDWSYNGWGANKNEYISYCEDFESVYEDLLNPRTERFDNDLAVLIIGSGDYTITDKIGNKATFGSNVITSSNDFQLINISNNFSGQGMTDDIFMMYLPYNEYTIKGNSKDKKSTSLTSYHKAVSTFTSENSTITMRVSDEKEEDNYAYIDFVDENQEFEITYEHDKQIGSLYDSISLKGISSNRIKTREKDGGIILSGLDAVTLAATSGEDKVSHSIDNIGQYDSIYVTIENNNNNKYIIIKGDSEGDGTYNILVDKITFEYNTSLSEFKIDYQNQQLFLPTNNNSIFYLGSVDKKGNVKSYELFEAGTTTTTIPLANFATSKEWKLKLYGNLDTTPIDIILTAGSKKLKAVYLPTELTIEKRIKCTDNGKEINLNSLEYRTAGSQWNDATTLTIDQLDAYAVYGTTLIFRIKAVEDVNPYSSDVKMKIPKLANAPKVTIDYTKQTIKFPTGAEYRTSHSEAWKACPTTKVNISSITGVDIADLYLEIRKVATDEKVASKIMVIDNASQQVELSASPTYIVDYHNQLLIVPTNSNTLFFIGVSDKKGVVKSYELFETSGTTAKIPLANFANTKEWKLKLYGNVDTTPVDITLVTRANKVKAVYTPTENSVYKRIKFINDGKDVDINKLEYRTASSQWLDASTLTIEQLDSHAVYGVTLIFRMKAVEDENPYSSEAKMKIPKLANAPKVTINYSQLTVKFPAGSEYRLQHSGVWTAAPTTVTNIENLTNIENTSFYLEVRKAASNGKVASKIDITAVDSQTEGPSVSTNGVLAITYSPQTGTTTSVKIKNTSNKDIEYAIISESSSIDLTKQSWKKLTAGGEAALKKNDSNGKIIIARYVAITGKNVISQFPSKISYSSVINWNE